MSTSATLANLLRLRPLRSALALSAALAVSACGVGDPAMNRSLDSVNQPVVSRQNFTLDLAAGPAGLSIPEQARLAGWFETLRLRYGDRISIDDPMASPETMDAVARVAARHGLLVAGNAPVTPGAISAGTVRVVVTRSTASVPNCPSWQDKVDTNFANATSPNYGCAINGNLAAMIANPEHLLQGATEEGETVTAMSDKAIDTYRTLKPTGAGPLKASATATEGN